MRPSGFSNQAQQQPRGERDSAVARGDNQSSERARSNLSSINDNFDSDAIFKTFFSNPLDFRQASNSNPLQQARVQRGITIMQLNHWREDGRFDDSEPKLNYSHQNQDIAKSARFARFAIAERIVRQNFMKFTTGEEVILQGVDFPSELARLASVLAGDRGGLGLSLEGSQILSPLDNVFIFCVQNGHSDVLEFLVKLGADVNMLMTNGCAPIHAAAQNGNSDVIERLAKLGADINKPSNEGITPVYFAAASGHADAVERLVKLGAKVNQPDNDGPTPVHAAAVNGHSNIIDLLHKLDANIINQPDNAGTTPVHAAALNGHSNVIDLLHKLGADINQPNKPGTTPVHAAALNGHSDAIDLLHKLGANVNQPDKTGITPVLSAAYKGHSNVIDRLVKLGANINIPMTDDGFLPVHAAALNGHSDAIDLLHKLGNNADQPANHGKTPVHIAAQEGHSNVIDLLHKLGANIDQEDNSGATPVFIAAYFGHADAVERLADLGADLNKPNKDGWTPISAATTRGNLRSASILRDRGAACGNVVSSLTSVYSGAQWLKGLWGGSNTPTTSSTISNSPTTSNPPQPSQQPIELTDENRQVIALLGDAINLDEVNDKGGIKIVTQDEFDVIMNTRNQVKQLQAQQQALCAEFEKIMGHTPQGLTKAQQDYFHAFLGAMQRFFIVSNALSSRLFQTKFDINMPDTPIEVLGMAAEKTSEALAASLPVVGIAFKGTAWLIAQLLENRMINHLSPFSELFQSPNQCAAVGYLLADQLARIKEPEIQSADIQDTPDTQTLLQRCKKIFAKYHLKTEEPDRVDKLAMQDVKKLMEYIYRLNRNQATMTINGRAYNYDRLQEAIKTNSNRDQIIESMMKAIMGLSMQVPTRHAPQNTHQSVRTSSAQSSPQPLNINEAESSAQIEQEALKQQVKELASKFNNIEKFSDIDPQKLRQMLDQHQNAQPSHHETLVGGRSGGQQQVQVQALAAKHLHEADGEHTLIDSLYKALLENHEFCQLLANEVCLLKEQRIMLNRTFDEVNAQLHSKKRFSSKELRQIVAKAVQVTKPSGRGAEGSASSSTAARLANRQPPRAHKEMIPEADPRFAVGHEDIPAARSTRQEDAASLASSGLNTDDEQDYDNILMSSIKRNADPDTFSSLLAEFPDHLNRAVTNKKGTSSSAFDFAGHYGRPELIKPLMSKKAQSAQNKPPFKVRQEAMQNKDKYDNEGRRKQHQ